MIISLPFRFYLWNANGVSYANKTTKTKTDKGFILFFRTSYNDLYYISFFSIDQDKVVLGLY